MRVLVEINFTAQDFAEAQATEKLPENTVEQKYELFVMYANPNGWCFWFIADYEVFPQLGWKISSPLDTYVVAADILLFSKKEQEDYCAVITATWS